MPTLPAVAAYKAWKLIGIPRRVAPRNDNAQVSRKLQQIAFSILKQCRFTNTGHLFLLPKSPIISDLLCREKEHKACAALVAVDDANGALVLIHDLGDD